MDNAILQPARFDSNMYLHRKLINDKLNELLQYRLNYETIKPTLEQSQKCDTLLKMEHYRFVQVISLIKINEMDVFRFGGLAVLGSDSANY